ncbi:MAG: hypothetical protein K8I03_02805 [Ignavibacteria bacterium]|nr:hypothetical protein [Ignavibacteria bacterium]
MITYSKQIKIGIILIAALVFTAASNLSDSSPQLMADSSPFVQAESPAMFSPNSTADSVVFQNDSTFTIEGVQDELSKDGEWIKVTEAEIDPNGVTESEGFDDEINREWVWRPNNMEPDWNPYTYGYWEYTNCGWMWVSYYSWGWRTSHYGRWWWSEYYGWVWSPGYVWAPAWVVWMYNDGYCGWYPISPRIRYHRHYGYRCHKMRYHTRKWRFCRKKDFADPLHPPVLVIDPGQNPVIITTSTYDGNLKVSRAGIKNHGPNIKDIENATGKKFEPVNVTKYNNIKIIEDKRDPNIKIKKTDDNSSIKNDKRDDNNSNKRYDPPPTDNNDKRSDDKSNEKKYEQPDKKKETYTPPTKKNDDNRKYDKPKDTYTPPPNNGNDNNDNNPGRKDNQPPPPPPPKNDDGNKRDDGNKQDDGNKKGR